MLRNTLEHLNVLPLSQLQLVLTSYAISSMEENIQIHEVKNLVENGKDDKNKGFPPERSPLRKDNTTSTSDTTRILSRLQHSKVFIST
jgi:hypothetical protein